MNNYPDQANEARELLTIYRRNLQQLEKQVALYGGESLAPLSVLNQLDQTRAEIERLEIELRGMETPFDENALAVPQTALLTRLEGLVGRQPIEELKRQLLSAQRRSDPQVTITGTGNIIGDNNTITIVNDSQLRKTIRQTAASITAPPTEFLPPIRVFVSSTMKDLQSERDAVARALQSLDLEVVRAESIGSQSASPYEVSLMMAQQCDIYLGIYGGRYGSIVPGDGRAITEIEYHTAREQGKPILLYRKTGVDVEPEQAEFLTFVGDMKQGHTWREFTTGDVPGQLMAWVQEDVRAEVQRHPEWAARPPTRERVLLASLGRSPGAVTGLYYALVRANKAVTRVVTFSPAHRDVRDAAGICADEFRRIGIPYHNHFIDAEDIESEADAREFKSMFAGLLQEHLAREAEVLVGITGGRTVMGALMAIVVQTTAPENVALYHLDVDDAIEAEGRLPELWRFEGTERWKELLAPPPDLCHLVQVPYVKFPTREN